MVHVYSSSGKYAFRVSIFFSRASPDVSEGDGVRFAFSIDFDFLILLSGFSDFSLSDEDSGGLMVC